MTLTPERLDAFMQEYEALCRKHNLVVWSDESVFVMAPEPMTITEVMEATR